ncbi:MAG: cobalamin-dependent protein [Dehalococcoidales bacterium]|jgi:5-methyltetrahydrofolate--homocysteine methyltransferase|nr:cobalamin-dependent protein [Dehalococcoidales bacterium]
MAGDLVNLLADLKEQEALKVVKDRLGKGDDALKILDDARKGMEIVGKRFAASQYFIPDLVYSGEILKGVSELVKPKLTKAAGPKKLGKVVFGTVAGDIHDIGKDIVVFMLDVSGFEVYDLGVDVPVQKFVDKIKETGAPVVGLSGFLTLAFDSMKQTIEAIKSAGLRDKVKVMIGGGQMSEEVRKYTGADAYGKDAMAGVSLAQKWISAG